MQFIKENYEQALSGGGFFVGEAFWEGWVAYFYCVFYHYFFYTVYRTRNGPKF